MTNIKIIAGPYSFSARLEENLAPKTCELFRTLLPYQKRLIHVRWSGEGCWIPLGKFDPQLPAENAIREPAVGQFIFYPGPHSETEILLAYGQVRFANQHGPLEGNHFLTITDGLEQVPELGHRVLWSGAQGISFGLR